ncbi:MAG: GntR family transcriptional regulator [Syntrophales bacterium]|jgi:DNA-binding GntR family transcriptional regulator|nr:GntR family transcriptional regulator [Syntrophales bacterium]
MHIEIFTRGNGNIEFRPTLLVEQVSNILINAILDDVLKGGEQLIETKLQKQFGISRTPLREAFRELEKRGFVEIISRKGTFVKPISLKEIEDNFPVRTVLEVLAAGLACKHISENELMELGNILANMKSAAQQKDAKLFWKFHFEFHDILISTCGNQLLIDTLNMLRMRTLRHRFYFQYHADDFEKSLTIHNGLLQLLHTKPINEKAVEEAMRDHLAKGFDKFVDYLKEKAPEKKED